MKVKRKTIVAFNSPKDLEDSLQKGCSRQNMILLLVEDRDARELSRLRELINNFVEKEGRIDYLLIFDSSADVNDLIRKMDISVFDKNLKTFWSILNLLYATYPHMMLTNKGRILLVLSSAGFEGYPTYAGCCVRGGALAGLFETFAQEAGEFNVNVSILHQPYLNGMLFKTQKPEPSKVMRDIFRALRTPNPILFNRKYRKIKRIPLLATLNSIKNKVILVTGAASGIGEAFSRIFASKGAKVILSDINESELNRVHSLIQSHNSSCLKLKLDVSNRVGIDFAFNQIKEEFGRLDVLVNNAGIAIMGLLRHLSLKDFQKTLSVNLLGPIYLTEKALPIFLQQRTGYIINIASIDACCPLPFLAPYNASKRALRFYSNILRMELQKQGIGVTTVYPGAVSTNISVNAAVRRESFSDEFISEPENALKGSYLFSYTPFQLAQKVIDGIKKKDPNQFQLPLTNKLVLGLWRSSPELILPLLRGAIRNMVLNWQSEKREKK